MKTVREIIVDVVNFFFNIVLPVDEEFESLQKSDLHKLSSKLVRVSDQKYPDMFSVFSYKDILVKKMIWHMKFRESHWVAETFGKFLADFITQSLVPNSNSIEIKKYILVPIPLHPKRFAERGYNQCEWLCEAIMKSLSEDFPGKVEYNKKILIRIKYRTKQSWSSRTERLENSTGIFAVRDVANVVGQAFILIDDVVTTGATLNEARRTLLAAGASSVICFTIAH